MHENSVCKVPGYLHDFMIQRTYENGVLEVCAKCKEAKFFKNNTPNRIYLSYHIRSRLQPYQKRFYKEYGHTG